MTHSETPQHHTSIKDLLEYGEADWICFQDEEEAKNTAAALLSTSGTTGLPKAAIISHYSCVMQNVMIQDSEHKTYKISRLITVPEFHAYAFPIAHISPLREGIPTYVMRRFDLHKYLTTIDTYQITETPMVPAIMHAILKKWPSTRPNFFSNPLGTLKLVWLHSEDGELVHRATLQNPAEISVRGPTIMQGYLGNSAASNEAIGADGWLKTGDLGYEEHGKFYIIDRKKEMIKVRGWQVSPAELESTLKIHPQVLDAAVIGVTIPISTIGESPRAYITRASDSTLSEIDVRTHMSTYLAAYKQLNGGIVFLDSIPRTSTGKIDRKVIKERARVEIGEMKEISIKTKISSAFHSVNHSSVQLSPHETPSLATQSFSGETAIEQDLRDVSKTLELSSFPVDSDSPTTTASSNERNFATSPTLASSVDSDVEGDNRVKFVGAAQRPDIVTAQRDTKVVVENTTGNAGDENVATSLER
ncbi:hypothetical protein P7C71_g1233, partial [Lecanoromycetidae sp. Uapishka_2]